MSLLSCQIVVALEALQIEDHCVQQDATGLLVLLQVHCGLQTGQEEL